MPVAIDRTHAGPIEKPMEHDAINENAITTFDAVDKAYCAVMDLADKINVQRMATSVRTSNL